MLRCVGSIGRAALLAAILPVSAAGQQPESAAAPTSGPTIVSSPVVQPLPGEAPLPLAEPVPLPDWSVAAAQQLASYVETIGEHGLQPQDYGLTALAEAIAAGPGEGLNSAAGTSFAWLVEDLRDGRTPMSARRQWFITDPDHQRMPTEGLLREALAGGDVTGVLDRLHPVHADYAALKAALAQTPESESDTRARIIINMDRWRWLPRDLGTTHLLANVPEFQLRLMVSDKVIRSYRIIVGRAGRTATPQLAEKVSGVIFNPTWTVPQSIVQGEGLGARVLNNPRWARNNGYVASRNANGTLSVVQQPGPGNALGLVKLDMPNPHAIFFHDTPAKHLFDTEKRAYSHGCIRTERALELGITLAIMGKAATRDEAVAISTSRKYTRVPLETPVMAYITYFTMGVDVDGQLRSFDDLYSRDAPVLASFGAPRAADRVRLSAEAITPIEAPGA